MDEGDPSSSPSQAHPLLSRFRQLIEQNEISILIVPSEDEHLGEYVSERDKRRQFVSGFSGSAGTAAITSDRAMLWTDGRYFLQATSELYPGWELMRMGTDPSIERWIVDNLEPGSKIGVNSQCLSIEAVRGWQSAFRAAGTDYPIVSLEQSFVDGEWKERPKESLKGFWEHSMDYAGAGVELKLQELRASLRSEHCSFIAITALDEICYLFNLRGQDIPFNPFVKSCAIVTLDDATLYIDEEREASDSQAEQKMKSALSGLAKCNVRMRNYDKFHSDVKDLFQNLVNNKPSPQQISRLNLANKLWLDPLRNTFYLYDMVKKLCGQLGEEQYIYTSRSPLALMKAVKNSTELACMKDVSIRDSVSLCNFLYWLDQVCSSQQASSTQEKTDSEKTKAVTYKYFDECDDGDDSSNPSKRAKLESTNSVTCSSQATKDFDSPKALTETVIAEMISKFRAQDPKYVGDSFEPIVASGPHGAIIHYNPSKSDESETGIDLDSMLLMDTGGQYLDGTTDVTRTVHFGIPSNAEKQAFTRVLMGHINLAKLIFPGGTSGHAIDVIARMQLWEAGMDYRHGTGHGVGSFLGVHEGPHGISFRHHPSCANLEAGMLVTNEPGFYLPGKFGVRIESLLTIIPKEFEEQELDATPYFGFETLTLVPIQKKLIAAHLMTEEQLKWLNDYHRKVYDVISSKMSDDFKRDWLRKATAPIHK